MSSQIFVLNTGSEIPALALETSNTPEENSQFVLSKAMSDGFRHFHLTSGHDNEESIAGAINAAIDSGEIHRNRIFITLTIACTPTTVIEKSLDHSLAMLGLDYVDLCLMQWENTGSTAHVPSHIETYRDLENLKRRWKTRAIGVSRYSLAQLRELVPQVSMKPSVNKINVSLFRSEKSLVGYCNWNGVLVLASVLGSGSSGFGEDMPLVRSLADDYRTTPDNIILSWHISSRRAVLLNSLPRDKASSTELGRGDVHQLNELSQGMEEPKKLARSVAFASTPDLNSANQAGCAQPQLSATQVLPVR